MAHGGEQKLIDGLKELTPDQRARFMVMYANLVTKQLNDKRRRRQARDQTRRRK